MPVTEYNFTKAGPISIERLTEEINADAGISQDVDSTNGIVYAGDGTDGLSISMVDALPSEEQTTLASVVAAHNAGSGVTLEPRYIITEKVTGKVASVKYYATDNGDDTYADLIYEELLTWSGNSLTKKETRRYFSDGVLMDTKTIEFFTGPNGNSIEKDRGFKHV